jgi:hypothetical protein
MIKGTDSTTSRRALLAGAPAVAAAALAAGTGANGLAIATTNPSGDAELLALKPEFDRLFDEWMMRRLRDQAEHRDYVAYHEGVFGFAPEDAPARDRSDPAYVAYDAAWEEMYEGWKERQPNGEERDPDLSEWDQFHEAFNPLADEILSHTATTLDGLRLQVRALISAYDEQVWGGESEHDVWLRGFVGSTCNVLGIPFPPLPDSTEARS